jgi:uncharacterized protein YbjQ (UPF0145 family)
VYGLLGLLFFLSSCSSPRYTVKFAQADSTFVCDTGIDHVYPFLEGEPIKFPYKRLGKVEVISNDRHYHGKMMDELMRKASKECANAVIGIYPDQLMMLNKHNVRVLRTRLNGLAVLINEDSVFKSRYKSYRKDMNLAKQESEEKMAKKALRYNTTVGLGIAFSLAIVLVLGMQMAFGQ